VVTRQRIVATDLIKQLEFGRWPQTNQDYKAPATGLQTGLAKFARNPQRTGEAVKGNQFNAISR
jgi:hypothetical protein